MSKVNELQQILKSSFITVNSTPDGEYTVVIQTNNLADAHLAHRKIQAIRGGDHVVKLNGDKQ